MADVLRRRNLVDELPLVEAHTLPDAELREAYAELARRLRDLEARCASLEAENAELEAFAHTVAHDLKNPVSQAMVFADFLSLYHDALPGSQLRDALQSIVRASSKINSIIEELLLLSQVRKIEVATEPLYMPSIVDEALGRVAQLAEDLQAEILVTDHFTWPTVIGHRAWVEEVWVNYLSNALKYGGRPPKIAVGAEPADGHMVRFWVRDNGRGLTPAEQERLFAAFERMGQVRATGYGLGLSIVRRIVEKLHGQIGVESEMGCGSTFSFALPRAPLG